MSDDNSKVNIDRLFRLPPGTLSSASKITMLGNNEMCVDGYRGVLEYHSELIRLNLGNRQLKIQGRGLSICVMERSYIEVEGYIMAIEFL